MRPSFCRASSINACMIIIIINCSYICTARACVRTVSSGLWKLSPCQTAAVDRRTAPARTKRRSPPHTPAWNARPCDTGAETVTLATCSPTPETQTVHNDAFHPHRSVPSISRRHGPLRRRQFNATGPALCRHHRLPEAEMQHQSWTAGICIRRPASMERPSASNQRHLRPYAVQKTTQNISV